MRRALLPLAFGLVALGLAVAPVAKPFVAASEARVRQVAAASTGVYVSLRTINAGISLIQEAEVGGAAGVTGSVRPLAWLDPIDDTVERMAGIVFWVALASGVLALALAPLSAVGWGLLGLALLLRCGGGVFKARTGRESHATLRASERGLFAVGGLFALLLPLALVAGIGLGERLTAERWAAAQATLAEVAQAADRVVEPYDAAPEDEGGWLEQLRQRLENTRDLVSGYYRSAGVFWDAAGNLLDASLMLAGIFLLRLVILPAALLWGALALARRLSA